MSSVRDESFGTRERKTSKNLRLEYTNFLNADEGLVEARRWIERVTFTKFKNDDFRESLADGVLLCELVVNVASMSIGRINRSSTQYAGKDNIKLFQRACEALGFDKSQLFEVDDLLEVPVKRGQNALDRAKESQRRLSKVGLTIYWLGKYANEKLGFSGSSELREECFEHFLENQLPELPLLEGADVGKRSSQYEPVAPVLQEITPEKEQNEIVTETGNFSSKREAFKQLEQESFKQAEEDEVRGSRRRSFSSGDKENDNSEEALKRHKSFGSQPLYKEGDSKFKHKKEILGSKGDPVRKRRERIEVSGSSPESSPAKMPITMRSPVDLSKKKSKFEEMERQASEEAGGFQGRRARPKSWVGSDLKSRGGSLKDKTSKFEDLQKQADKERAVLHGELRMPAVDCDVRRQDKSPVLSAGSVKLKDKHSKFEQLDKAAQQQTLVLQGRHDEIVTDFTYDIGDKVNGPISLPGAVDVKLRDKKKQFETLDYKAQRESSILKLHSGKSFDDPTQNPIPLNTASRRAADIKARPKSNLYDYQSFPPSSMPMEVDREEILKSEPIKPREMNFSESTPDEMDFGHMNDHGSWKSVSPTPPAPPRGDSLSSRHTTQNEPVNKPAKTPLYNSFTNRDENVDKEKGKRQEMNYKQFVSYPVTKQKDRVQRYNAALQELSKEPVPKNVGSEAGRPRKKSLGNDEWIKVKAVEEPMDDIPKKQIKKLWDREPDPQEGVPHRPVQTSDTSFDKVEKTTDVPNVQNMRYRDFSAAPKKQANSVVISRAPVVEISNTQRKKSENRNEPFSNFAQQPPEDVTQPAKKKSMSYQDFVVPPPKADSVTKAQKVKSLTRRFMEIEAEQNKPKSSGPPALKPVVDREELVRYERESRARSWYGVDDEELEGVARRRVRRWSDYEYEEGDQRSAPWQYENQEPLQNGDVHAYEHQGHSNVFEEPEPYKKPYEPEVEVKQTTPVESKPKEWFEVRPPPIPPPPAEETEIKPQFTKPVKSILKHDPYEEPVASKPELNDMEQDRLHPVEVSHTRVYHQPQPVQPQPVQPQPFQHQPVHPHPVQSHPIQPPSTHPHPTQPHVRNIASRSWNDFESSVRKKSMELIESRPTTKPNEPREIRKTEPYKLKRPGDYVPKQQWSQAPTTTTPTYQQPPTQEVHQFQYDYKSVQSDHDSQQPSHVPMPTSYPTYVESDVVSAENSPAVVETGKPLFVSARLHDKESEAPGLKSPSASRASEIAATEKVSPPEIQSNVESEPQDFKAQQKLWEYKTAQLPKESEEHTPSHPEVGKLKDRETENTEVQKYVIDPDLHTIQQKTEPEKQEELPVQKQKRPQVFAIVGQVQPVRPTLVELPKPTTSSQIQTSPKEVSPPQQLLKMTNAVPQNEEPMLEERPRPVLKRTPSVPKVFNFVEETEEPVANTVQRQPVPPKETTPKEQSVVMETVTVVEKSKGPEDDIFKALDDEEERMKKNLQDPQYRERLRKEVELENKKQREEAQYLTNLQMRPDLGSKEDNFVQEEDERLRQEQLESVSQTALKKDIYDINANRKDYPIYENLPRDPREIQMNGLQQVPIKNDIHSYPDEKRKEESQKREYEQERRVHERSGRPLYHHPDQDREREEEYRRQKERQDRPARRPSSGREREEEYRREQERLGHPPRRPSSGREREEEYRREQERQGHPPRRPSSGREREEEYRREQERQGRPRRPSSDRGYEEDHRRRQERRGRSQEDLRRPHERRGRSPHRYPNSERGSDDETRKEERRNRDRQRGRSADGRYSGRNRDDYRPRDGPRREHDRPEDEFRKRDRKEHERREYERREHDRRERERIEHERREQARIEHERREQERLEYERKEQERIDQERLEVERMERERIEKERLAEEERLEKERIERERRQEEERLEKERIERERRQEEERLERERIEIARRQEEERLERERIEIARREEEERLRRERIEQDRLAKERLELERLEQDRLRQERIEQERREQERMEWERLEQERIAREHHEQEQERRRLERERYDQDRMEEERRKREHYERERYERERYDRERRDRQPRGHGRRPPSDYYDDRYDYDRHNQERPPRDRREQERYEQEKREHERRERHRREQENLTPEEREQHKLNQQRHVHELIAQQRQEEMEQEQQYKEMLSKEQQHIYGVTRQRKSTSEDGMWEKIEDGSGFDIYSTFIDDEQSPIVCTSCGMSIVKDQTMYVRELNQYWHETCFRCVVCHIIFGSKEQRSPLKVTDSLLHCENCFITNEGDKCTEV